MQIINNIEYINAQQWEAFLQASPTASWFQSKAAYDFYASLPEVFEPFVFAVSQEGQMLRALCVGYITQEKSKIKQFFTRRAIIIGGPLLASDATQEEVTALMQTVREALKHKAIYIETRNFFDYSQYKPALQQADFKYNPHLNFQVDTTSTEVIEKHLGRNRKRDIKTSFRDGALIIENPTIEQVKEWYSILLNLYMTKVKTPLFSWAFFEKIYTLPSAHYLLVQVNNEICGGTLCVGNDGERLYEWFVCGLDGELKTIFPSTIATYAGMLYAANHNCPIFDMMGAGTPDEAYGVRDFKARFGGTLVEHGRFQSLCNPLLYKIGTYAVKWLHRTNR